MRPFTVLAVGFVLLGTWTAACLGGPAAADSSSGRGVTVEWYGHACFEVTTINGIRIVIDPFNPEAFAYTLPTGPVTLAFASHNHSDHNHLSGVDCGLCVSGGDEGAVVADPPEKIPEYGTYRFGGDSLSYTLLVVPSFHDDQGGERRGRNAISVWGIDGLRIVHLGDLGCDLDEKQVEAIGRPDLLLIPVGGYYTIDAEQAGSIVKKLSPRLVVPMHFKTDALGDRTPISGVDEFLEIWKKVRVADGSKIRLAPGMLPEGPEIVLLKYHGQVK